ncbi:hypothetical protein [Paraburkholderia silvatlantica]|uniref:hypothetical protein n=1 Tax=Paraburkholderia silvatlantica TaxID=321895 RepID=UPI0037517503
MPASNPDSTNQRITLSLSGALMERLQRYARQSGTSPEAILLESVATFLDRFPLTDHRRSPAGD